MHAIIIAHSPLSGVERECVKAIAKRKIPMIPANRYSFMPTFAPTLVISVNFLEARSLSLSLKQNRMLMKEEKLGL